MARNFNIKLYKSAENIKIRLKGDFDGNSAYELINAISDNLECTTQIKIDTDKLRKIFPFGKEVFRHNLPNVLGSRTRIEFGGKNAARFNLEQNESLKLAS